MNSLTEEQMMDLPVRRARRTIAEIDHQGIKKLYWTIGEVADMNGVATSAIRYYELMFNLEPGRTRKGDRKYTEGEKHQMGLIVKLCRHYKLETVQSIVRAGVEFEAVVKLEEIMARV